MERRRKGRERRLVRASEVSRQSDQALTLAYEQVWPLLLRVVRETRPQTSASSEVLKIPTPVARSA